MSGVILLQIEVANDRCSEVRGEICWEDPFRNLFGIHLIRVDAHWNDFVKYLMDDFDSLTDAENKKTA